MKILHIGKFYPPFHGGMENYLCDLAREQAEMGHEVTVWVHNHNWQGMTSKSLTSTDDGVYLIRQRALKPIFFTPIMLGFAQQLKQIFKHQKPDIIHLHWPNPSVFKLLLNRQAKKVPWVISWHSDMVTKHSSVLMKMIYWLIKPLESKLVKQSKSLLVSTQEYANHSTQLSKYTEKTVVIPLGMSTKEIASLDLISESVLYQQAANKWQDSHFKLFHVGRLTFYKNQSFLITAMAGINDAQLLIAGEGQLKQQLNQQITQEQLQDKVALLGAQEWSEIHALFASCDVFCMASHDRAESFGVVLLEAMYHDKIILVPDTVGSGMHWLARNYNKGFVYKVNDSSDFIAKINHIRQNLAQIVGKPKQFKYQIQHVAESVVAHYNKILIGDKS